MQEEKKVYKIDLNNKQGYRKHIGKRLKDLRKSLGITKYIVAKDLGLSNPTLDNYENGRVDMSVHKLLRLCDYYGTDLNFLIYGDETNEFIYET